MTSQKIKKHHLSNICRIILFLLACLWLTSSPLYAQSPSISAEVDQTSVPTRSTFTLTVVVNGNSNSSPTLPPLEGFQIVGSSTSSQITIINGEMTTQSIYRYLLESTYIGDFVIEPITISIDGQSYSTEPLKIRVVQGAAPTASPPSSSSSPSAPEPPPQATPGSLPSELAGQDFFVEAEVDNPTPYLGQQITYIFRFYHAVRLLGQLDYKAPDFTSFWNEQESTQTDYTRQNQDRLYQVIELQTVLFPTIVGERTIEPASLTLTGFFSRGQRLSTEPVTLTVQPLPDGAPAEFNGAVGEFDITATVDSNQVAANEPVTLRVTLQGEGNIATLPEPTLPELADWRAFERTSTVNTEVQQGILSGNRVDEQLLVPTKSGEFTIPPISYAFFNPKTEKYETVTSEAIPITVLPGAEAERAAESTEPAMTGTQEVTPFKIDIRHIKNVPPALSQSSSPPLPSRLGYWLAWLVPFLLLLVNMGWQWGKRRSGNSHRSQALQKALERLSQANEERLYSTISQALNGYLTDKLEEPVVGLTHNALNERLSQKGLEPSLIQRLQELLIQCDIARFTPQADTNRTQTALLKESREMLNELERSLS